jgi:hypothetical protein
VRSGGRILSAGQIDLELDRPGTLNLAILQGVRHDPVSEWLFNGGNGDKDRRVMDGQGNNRRQLLTRWCQ